MTTLTDAFRVFKGQHEPRREVISGWMADPEGYGDPIVRDETTGDPTGYYYCMIDRGDGTNSGDFIKVWGGGIRPVAGWPVLIGTTRERPWELSILSIDKEAMGGGIDKYAHQVEPHHETHEWGDPSGSDDVVYPRWLQLYDFSVWPVPRTRAVTIADGVYDPSGIKVEFPYTTVNLESYAPSGTGTSRWVIVCIDPTGTVQLYACPSGTNLDINDICQVPYADWWELAAVKLWQNDASINMTPGAEEIIDLRFARVGFPQHGGLGSGTNWENVYIVAKSGGDFTTLQAALNIAGHFDAIWLMPGAWEEDLTWGGSNVTLAGWATEFSGPYASLIQGAGDIGPMLSMGTLAGGGIQGVIFNRELTAGAGEYTAIDASTLTHNSHLSKSRVHISQDVAVGRDITGVKISGRTADGKESSINQCVIIAETVDAGVSAWETAVKLYGSKVFINDSYLYGDIIDAVGTTLDLRNCYVEGDITGTTGGDLYIDAGSQITGTVSGWDNVYMNTIKGAPLAIYSGVKATIEATFSNAGMIAYASNTGQLGYYDAVGASWNWGNLSGTGVSWGNVIIVAASGGDYTTIGAAIAAASAGDVILVMPGTYIENVTMVSSVSVVGLSGLNTVIQGTVTFSGTVTGATLENIYVNPGGAAAVIHSSSGTNNLLQVQVQATGADAKAVNQTGGALFCFRCYLASSGSPNQGVYATGAGVSCYLIGGYASTITQASSAGMVVIGTDYTSSSGTLTYLATSAILEPLKTVDGSGSGLDADLLDTYHAASPPTASAVPVLNASGDLLLPSGGDALHDGHTDVNAGLGRLLELSLGDFDVSKNLSTGTNAFLEPGNWGWLPRDATWVTWALGLTSGQYAGSDDFYQDNYAGGTSQWSVYNSATPIGVEAPYHGSGMLINVKKSGDASATHACLQTTLTSDTRMQVMGKFTNAHASYPFFGGAGSLGLVFGVGIFNSGYTEGLMAFGTIDPTIVDGGNTAHILLDWKYYFHASTAWAPGVATNAAWTTNWTSTGNSVYVPYSFPLTLGVYGYSDLNRIYIVFGNGNTGLGLSVQDIASYTHSTTYARGVIFASTVGHNAGRNHVVLDWIRFSTA